MKRKILSLFLSSITIISVCSLYAISASAKNYSSTYGYYTTFTKSISALNKNTKIGYLEKSFPSKTYSKCKIATSSTVSKMNVWVMNEDDKWESEKYTAYPTGNKVTIYYYTGITFTEGSRVYLWGEQSSTSKKTAKITFYAY